MHVAVLSDVHSNFEALTAVLEHADRLGTVEALWCAGDIVGYGADPAAVIDLLRQRDVVAIAGNHDLVAADKMDTAEFNPVAAEAALWTARVLSHEHREWLGALPEVRIVGDVTLVHGSLRAPAWEYLLEPEQAHAQFALQTTPISIVGHSHQQFVFLEEPGEPRYEAATPGVPFIVDGRRVILNPGSSGQPRDRDPRAAYMTFDDATKDVTWHRVEYDIAAAQRKIIAAGLDPFLARRLSEGR